MPLTLNVGVTKKIGQPDFGSRGASCHVSVEIDQSLLRQDLETFHAHVRTAFAACRKAVEGELAGHEANGSNSPANGQDHHRTNGDGHPRDGNGHSRTRDRKATQSQVRAIRAIAGRRRIDLAELLQERFNVSRPDELSLSDASSLIDDLKSGVNGHA